MWNGEFVDQESWVIQLPKKNILWMGVCVSGRDGGPVKGYLGIIEIW